MRVTNSSYYRNFTNSINDVHGRLNKSMNKVSSGKAYEKASDNPLAYYEGKKIDNQYQDTLSKLGLITNVKNRLYQQELGPVPFRTGCPRPRKRLSMSAPTAITAICRLCRQSGTTCSRSSSPWSMI